jgi:hypothetical protein
MNNPGAPPTYEAKKVPLTAHPAACDMLDLWDVEEVACCLRGQTAATSDHVVMHEQNRLRSPRRTWFAKCAPVHRETFALL